MAVFVVLFSAAPSCSLLVNPTRVEDGAVGDVRPPADADRPADGSPADSRADLARDAGISDGARGDGDAGCRPGAPCNDGDPCTINDKCTVAGGCAGDRAPDGTRWGNAPSKRCCGGKQVHLATDENNCGGCGIACRPGYACRGAAQSTSCSIRPKDTTGRCRCANGANTLCPKGQSCVWERAIGYLCSPTQKSQCAPGETLQFVPSCPNFCRY